MEFKFFQSDVEIGIMGNHEFSGFVKDIDSEGFVKSVDIFSQGCPYGWFLSDGKTVFLQEGFVD